MTAEMTTNAATVDLVKATLQRFEAGEISADEVRAELNAPVAEDTDRLDRFIATLRRYRAGEITPAQLHETRATFPKRREKRRIIRAACALESIVRLAAIIVVAAQSIKEASLDADGFPIPEALHRRESSNG